MKRLLLGVVVFFVVPLAVAQTEGERVSPLSGRYSFEIPEGWVASTLPVDDNFQGLFPNEALTIAPPQEDFSSEFELIGESDFAGEGIVSVVWPAGLLSSLGLDAAGFGEQLVAANQEGNTVEEVAFSAGEAEGTLYRLEAAETASESWCWRTRAVICCWSWLLPQQTGSLKSTRFSKRWTMRFRMRPPLRLK